MTLSTGANLNNRYRIAKLVGQGGFGAVYRAWDTSLNRPVAVKENFDTGPQSQRQFEREAQLLAALRHPNLPVVGDYFILPGQGQYLVMDFVEGRSLDTLLNERGGPLDEAEVLPWIRQVCDALDYLHTQTPPVIHRDIKPENIIITDKGRAMLVDFGISKVYDPNKGTTVGAKAVTPGYSPPEQYGRGRTDARSDVYALGATLYTLLTGQVPPEGPDLSSGADVLTPPRQANPAVSTATSAAVVAAMAPTISRRLAGATAFAGLLPVAAAPAKVRTPPPVAPTMPIGSGGPGNPAAKRGVPVWGWIGGVIALVALAVWAGMAFGGRNGGGATPEATAEIAIVAADTPMPAATRVPPTATARPSPTNKLKPTSTATATPPPTPTAEPQTGDVSGRVGIVLPSRDQPRWVQDETRFRETLEEAGYEVEILHSQGDSARERQNVEDLITQGIQVLIITPHDGTVAAAAAEAARDAGVPVISYDRLIRDTDAVDYYVTFDNIAVGAQQAQFLVDNAEGEGNPLYLYTGAATDSYAFIFFEGAWGVLQPKIADGTFRIVNSSEAVALQDKGELTREEMSGIIDQVTTNWDFNTAKNLADFNLTEVSAKDKGDVFILAPNDDTARSIADVFATDPDVTSFLITGQDAEQASVQYIINGRQAMTVFKDVRTLVDDAIAVAVALLAGEAPNATGSYNNGVINVPAILSPVVTIDRNNVVEALINSGYYNAEDFTGLD